MAADLVQPEGATTTGASKTDGAFTISKAQFLANFGWLAASNKAVR